MGMDKKEYQDNKAYNKAYYQANKEKINDKAKAYNKAYRNATLEKRKAQAKAYYQKNKAKHVKRVVINTNKRRQIDPVFKLRTNMTASISKAIKRKNWKKTSKTEQMLGCSFEQFKQHIESKFESWMTWDNRGLYNGLPNYGWDVDHIIPVSSAKTIEELHKLCHYTNLQPLCSYINRDIKRNKQ